jgi:Niemann-Pick C1 protein
VCCTSGQVQDLADNLQIASSILSSCPACKKNFYDFFCSFTCSPNQSSFLNVTATTQPEGKNEMVTEVDFFVNPSFGEGFYKSCKDVKFSTTNGYVMDLIGGGAQNYKEFFVFLGQKRLGGSPFQINFPDPTGNSLSIEARRCDDSDYRCPCVDCPSTCPNLPSIPRQSSCHAGVISCWSLVMILLYTISLLAILALYSFRTVFSYKQRPLRLSTPRTFLTNPSTGADSDVSEEDSLDGARSGDKFGEGEYPLDTALHRTFYKLGVTCATYPIVTIGLSLAAVGVLCLGWMWFAIETDPVKLWVSPSSEAAQQKEFFDVNFGPFYRAEQAFLVNETGPVLTYDTLLWWADVEARVAALSSPEGVTLQDVCFKPVAEACVVQSVMGYFANGLDKDNWKDELELCVSQPVQCLPAFKQPLKPSLILSGDKDGVPTLESRSMITTWVVNNGVKDSETWVRADEFEKSLKELMHMVQEEASARGLRLSFSTERSLEEELNKSTNTDAKIVVISYVVMFIYASLALGSVSLTRSALVTSKFTLGLFGIVIVLLSVLSSVGIFSAFGIKTTLIIAEVIPFFVLAVGVDNIFLIVHEFSRMNSRFSDEAIEHRVGRALGRMGPSILLSAVSETVAFSLGALVGMPAVRNFAVYAAGAVIFDAMLQCTMFVAALALDQKRVEANRVDCFPLIRAPGRTDYQTESRLTRGIRRWYAPLIVKRTTKITLNAVFFGIFAAALALLPGIQLGLDQRIAIPNDSYLIQYFNDLDRYFVSGPPVYFVAQDVDVTTLAGQQALCGRFSTCEQFSMANVLEQERKRSDVSYIAEPAASWIDDFIHWLNPEITQCCRVRKGTDGKQLCRPGLPDRLCDVCYKDHDPAWNITLHGSPRGEEFMHYLDFWLKSVPDDSCPLGGAAAYKDAVVIDNGVKASHFRTSHTNLNHQKDYIEAYKAAIRVAQEIGDNTGATVFPYSVFYIFFDQYLSIVPLTFTLLGSALAVIFVASAILLGSLMTAALLVLTVTMVVVDVAGVMVLWGVSLNAVSLVNLVICVGIGVEFCAHIAKSFTVPSPSAIVHVPPRMTEREDRACCALVSVGSSVFSGITLTKFVGVTVLAFTRSKIFEIYYFRIWLALVILAALHGLVFFPALLSSWGGRAYASLDAHDGLFEEEWQNDASQRSHHTNEADNRYSEALLASDPLLGENDSDDES